MTKDEIIDTIKTSLATQPDSWVFVPARAGLVNDQVVLIPLSLIKSTMTMKVEVGIYSLEGAEPIHFTTEAFSPFFPLFEVMFIPKVQDLSQITAENLFTGRHQ